MANSQKRHPSPKQLLAEYLDEQEEESIALLHEEEQRGLDRDNEELIASYNAKLEEESASRDTDLYEDYMYEAYLDAQDSALEELGLAMEEAIREDEERSLCTCHHNDCVIHGSIDPLDRDDDYDFRLSFSKEGDQLLGNLLQQA